MTTPVAHARVVRALRRYAFVWLILGLALGLAQSLAMPYFLVPAQLVGVSVAISAIQFGLALFDLGTGLTANDIRLGIDRRRDARASGLSLSWLVALLSFLLVIAAYLGNWLDVSFVEYFGLGFLTAAVLMSVRFKALDEESLGQTGGALGWHFAWQNAPKFGLIAGAAIWSSAVGALIAQLFISLPLCARAMATIRPRLPRIKLSHVGSAATVAASIGLGWADTYVLFGVVGQSEAGAYQATYRVATSLSYLYIPIGSAVVSAINAGRYRQVRRLGYLGGWALLVAGLACIPVLGFLQRRVWGVEYELPTTVTMLLLGSSLMAGLSYISGLVLAAWGRRGVMLWANVTAVLMLLGLSFVLIPIFGTVGAALSSFLAYSAAAIAQSTFAIRQATGHGRRHDKHP